jgi:hypothetical protein
MRPWLCVAHEKEIPDFTSFSAGGFKTYALGVGQFKSLARISELTAMEKPNGVVLAGTCGTTSIENVMQVFCCQHFAYPHIENEELPEFMEKVCETMAAINAVDLRPATVLQNHGLSLNAEKFRLNTANIPRNYPHPILENMEASSLAFFCNERRIPFTAILCATNLIGSDARAQWRKNFPEAGSHLASALSSLTVK